VLEAQREVLRQAERPQQRSGGPRVGLLLARRERCGVGHGAGLRVVAGEQHLLEKGAQLWLALGLAVRLRVVGQVLADVEQGAVHVPVRQPVQLEARVEAGLRKRVRRCYGDAGGNVRGGAQPARRRARGGASVVAFLVSASFSLLNFELDQFSNICRKVFHQPSGGDVSFVDKNFLWRLTLEINCCRFYDTESFAVVIFTDGTFHLYPVLPNML
jgi:hypothetical protein